MPHQIDKAKAKHLVPDDVETAKVGVTVYRDAVDGEQANYAVDRVLHTTRVSLEADDPYTLALVFRELRRITRRGDVNYICSTLEIEFDSLTKEDLANLDALEEITWVMARPRDTKVDRIYYKKR